MFADTAGVPSILVFWDQSGIWIEWLEKRYSKVGFYNSVEVRTYSRCLVVKESLGARHKHQVPRGVRHIRNHVTPRFERG